MNSAICRRTEPSGGLQTAGAWGGKSGGLERHVLWNKTRNNMSAEVLYDLLNGLQAHLRACLLVLSHLCGQDVLGLQAGDLHP